MKKLVQRMLVLSWILCIAGTRAADGAERGVVWIPAPVESRFLGAMPFETEKGLAEALAGQMGEGDRLFVWDAEEQVFVVYERDAEGVWVCGEGADGVVDGGAARAGQGFWVENRGETEKTIRLEGSLPGEVVVEVRPGLNLVGLAGLGDRTAKEAGLGELLAGGCVLMDAAGSNLTVDAVMKVGVGYWLRNPGETARRWTVSRCAGESVSPAVVLRTMAGRQCVGASVRQYAGAAVKRCAGGKAVLPVAVPGEGAGKGTQERPKAVGGVERGARPWVVVQKPRMWRP
jgi:hypothetical protein